MPQELLPCPFCGGEATMNERLRNGYRFVECESCAFGLCAERTEAEAIAAWNDRTQSGNWQETLNDIARLEADNAALKKLLTEKDALIHQLGENAATAAREYAENMEALRAERDNLAGIVQGWHYLAVGPDEMGDYYTHKQLVKLSEPYASPALRALTERKP